MLNSQSFDRDECFDIFLELLKVSNFANPALAIQKAISLSQTFHGSLQDCHHLPAPPTEKPIDTLCRYFSNDNALLVETSSGERHLLHEYHNAAAAAAEAQYLNSRYEVNSDGD